MSEEDEFTLPAPLLAVAVDDAAQAARFGERPGVAGAFSFEEAAEDRGFWGWIKFTCPCGCGALHRLPIGLKNKPPRGIDAGGVQATWMWDGDRDRPTITPSINHQVGKRSHWHGFLTRGWFHQPSQTVPV